VAIRIAETALAEGGRYLGDLLALLEDGRGEVIWRRQFDDAPGHGT
jgi:hypothetical protein